MSILDDTNWLGHVDIQRMPVYPEESGKEKVYVARGLSQALALALLQNPKADCEDIATMARLPKPIAPSRPIRPSMSDMCAFGSF